MSRASVVEQPIYPCKMGTLLLLPLPTKLKHNVNAAADILIQHSDQHIWTQKTPTCAVHGASFKNANNARSVGLAMVAWSPLGASINRN